MWGLPFLIIQKTSVFHVELEILDTVIFRTLLKYLAGRLGKGGSFLPSVRECAIQTVEPLWCWCLPWGIWLCRVVICWGEKTETQGLSKLRGWTGRHPMKPGSRMDYALRGLNWGSVWEGERGEEEGGEKKMAEEKCTYHPLDLNEK